MPPRYDGAQKRMLYRPILRWNVGVWIVDYLQYGDTYVEAPFLRGAPLLWKAPHKREVLVVSDQGACEFWKIVARQPSKLLWLPPGICEISTAGAKYGAGRENKGRLGADGYNSGYVNWRKGIAKLFRVHHRVKNCEIAQVSVLEAIKQFNSPNCVILVTMFRKNKQILEQMQNFRGRFVLLFKRNYFHRLMPQATLRRGGWEAYVSQDGRLIGGYEASTASFVDLNL